MFGGVFMAVKVMEGFADLLSSRKSKLSHAAPLVLHSREDIEAEIMENMWVFYTIRR